MGYYTRILGTYNPNVPLEVLTKALKAEGLKAKLELLENESPKNWTVIDVMNEDDEQLFQIERNPVIAGELGQEELDEFREAIEDLKPATAVAWLQKYFDRVKVIYAFQLLESVFDDENYPILAAIKEAIKQKVNGIFQADNEGFTNEAGAQILWDFSDDVEGDWTMAVLSPEGEWIDFNMELGDRKQREAFFEGKVPL